MDTYNFILVIADSFRTSLKEDKAPDIIAQPSPLTRAPPVLTSQLLGITRTILLAHLICVLNVFSFVFHLRAF